MCGKSGESKVHGVTVLSGFRSSLRLLSRVAMGIILLEYTIRCFNIATNDAIVVEITLMSDEVYASYLTIAPRQTCSMSDQMLGSESSSADLASAVLGGL